ncbi:hypothetical protein BRADI_5g01286v3 [Brachypodium distachyon]|uniref:40S ribosomal protein S21 n=1 Tax=Brachypodium distachyon TaxID=15368 RepID=A0A0Q3GL80_BRADI|nr:hypothetical protein BRADI_5g01286v3 [Brachypodium distachyon]
MVDLYLYVPRKCSATNSIITAKDRADVQINIALLNCQFQVSSFSYSKYLFSS